MEEGTSFFNAANDLTIVSTSTLTTSTIEGDAGGDAGTFGNVGAGDGGRGGGWWCDWE